MKPLVLYCKSYSTDLKRIIRLARSVQQFNTENIPFFVSVAKAEFELFRDHLCGLDVHLITDEEIIQVCPRTDPMRFRQLSGSKAQQVVKSEFWRLRHSEAYLCLDSDAVFIRPFGQADFLAPDGTPYTVIDEAQELFNEALRHKRRRIVESFGVEADQVQHLFGRIGRRYSFGPFPLVWHQAVWESLDSRYLKPRGMSFADAIEQAPIESRWYGEALLAYRAIALLPCQSLFKVYHYAWQFDLDRRLGVGNEDLSTIYCGIIFQSAWEREMDWPAEGGNLISRAGRRVRRALGRI
jgi:hypothetical protein